MKIEQIVNRFIVELEECALQNNVDECDECIANDNCTYRKEILSAISTLERLRPVVITKDESTWPESYKQFVMDGVVRERTFEGIYIDNYIPDHGDDGKNYPVNYFIGKTWQYLPDWSEE